MKAIGAHEAEVDRRDRAQLGGIIGIGETVNAQPGVQQGGLDRYTLALIWARASKIANVALELYNEAIEEERARG